MTSPESPFAHAVASFDPTSTSVLLWTRLGGGWTEVSWVLASDPELADVVAAGEASTSADHDHTVVVDVEGLSPATSYWYRFSVGGWSSPVGRTRTVPAEGASSFRMAAVCCARYSVAPLGVYRAVAEREVDLVLHLGDYIYEDDGSKGPRTHEPPRTAVSLDDYRQRIGQIRADPDAQALHLRHPMTVIWDDHDLADNAWADGAKEHDPAEHGPWPERAAAAAQARAEWLPSRRRDPDDVMTTWRSLEIGDLAEVLLLDTRLQGRDRHAGDDESPDLDDPTRSLLGADQRAWLRERLADVERPWAVVASSVVVNELELSWPRPLRWVDRLLPNGYAVLDGRVLHDDQWDGYPAERSRLVGWLADRGRSGGRTVILSGDVHSSWAFEGPRLPEGAPVAVEMTTPAVSSAAMGRARLPGMWRLLDRQAKRLDHVRFAEVTQRGYCTLDLTRHEAIATWWLVDPWDDEPGATSGPQASYRTSHADWPPRLEEVEPATDPDRAGLMEPLPPRPDDLRSMRRSRTLRLAAETVLAATAIAAVCGSRLRRTARSRPLRS